MSSIQRDNRHRRSDTEIDNIDTATQETIEIAAYISLATTLAGGVPISQWQSGNTLASHL